MNVVRKKSIKIVFVSVALLLVAMFAFLKSRTYDPMSEALAIYNEAIDSGQAESGKKFVLFKPPAANSGKNSACFVFYQGALVEELSYVPLMQGIANEGVPSYLISMPLNIAMLSVNAADLAKADPYAKQHCQRFVIGGHSLGGVAASMYLSSYPPGQRRANLCWNTKDGLFPSMRLTMVLSHLMKLKRVLLDYQNRLSG